MSTLIVSPSWIEVALPFQKWHFGPLWPPRQRATYSAWADEAKSSARASPNRRKQRRSGYFTTIFWRMIVGCTRQ
jgi:hypothetical protein